MISAIISRVVILVFGTLYPAYASYKGVRTKNTKEYVKWMMYWIVFALFTCIETFTDIFLSWFPFYYEIKIILVIWLLSPATKGSSILYRKFVHPMLINREKEIDEYISKAKEQSYKQFLDIGQKGVTALMQTALKSEIVENLLEMLSQPDVVRIDQKSAQPGSADPEPGPSDTHSEAEEQAVAWNFNNKNDPVTNAIRAMLAEGPPGPRTGPGKGKIKYRRNAICFEGLPD